MKKSDVVIVNISGRGDKDMGILRENLKLDCGADHFFVPESNPAHGPEKLLCRRAGRGY
jgi:hypothetical protein